MLHKKTILILITAILIHSIPMAALERTHREWDKLDQMRQRQRVRVMVAGGQSLQGKLLGFNDNALSLQINKQEVVVRRSEVLSIGVGKKTGEWRNKLLATGLGVALGVASVAFADSGNRSGRRRRSTRCNTRRLTPGFTPPFVDSGTSVGGFSENVWRGFRTVNTPTFGSCDTCAPSRRSLRGPGGRF